MIYDSQYVEWCWLRGAVPIHRVSLAEMKARYPPPQPDPLDDVFQPPVKELTPTPSEAQNAPVVPNDRSRVG